jgi:hypothetical protein
MVRFLKSSILLLSGGGTNVMSHIRVGDHVQLKGLNLQGYSGTVLRKPHWLTGNLRVRLDAGQLRGGSTMVSVNRINIKT